MCNRYNGLLSTAEIQDAIPYTQHHHQELAAPRTNVGPMSRGAVVVSDKGQLTLDHLMWGIDKTFNCRLESLQTLKSKWNRCQPAVVPMRGYYEWQTGVEKTPYYFSDSKTALALAVFDSQGFAVLTRPATKKLARIHHRMPVLVSSENAVKWVNGRFPAVLELAEDYIEPEYHRVSTRVNKVSNQDEDLAKPVKTFDIGMWAKRAKPETKSTAGETKPEPSTPSKLEPSKPSTQTSKQSRPSSPEHSTELPAEKTTQN